LTYSIAECGIRNAESKTFENKCLPMWNAASGSESPLARRDCEFKNPKPQIRYLKLNCLESFLNFEPAALETVVKNQSCQISHAHIPHGSAGSDEKNK
jgi:hypothetical protein